MNKKKRYSTSVLLLLVVMTITACSGKQSDSTDNTVVAYKPQYSKYEYTFDKSKEVYSNFYGGTSYTVFQVITAEWTRLI